MEDFRSKSYHNDPMNIATNGNTCYAIQFADHLHRPASNPTGMQDLRCHSASYATSSAAHMDIVPAAVPGGDPQWKFKKGKSTNGAISKSWSFNDPELQRKKRVASYKAYGVEGKLKGSIKKSFRWIKDRCSQMVYGYR